MSGLFSRLNRLWRAAMTGVCFALFGLGGLLLSVVWFNLLLVAVRDKQRRRSLARRSISASFRLFLTVVKSIGVLDYHIEGQAMLRQDRGCLVVANHPSLIDYVMLASVMPETDCMVKSALLHNPFLSGKTAARLPPAPATGRYDFDFSRRDPYPSRGKNDVAARRGEYRRTLRQRFASGGYPLYRTYAG